MKSKEILRILNITRPTLTRYLKLGYIKANTLPTGRYDYDEKSVYNFLNKNIERKTYIYARVSTSNQKKDLENQINILKQYCFSTGIQLNGIYKDISSGIDFTNRKEFFILLDEVLSGKVEKVVITYKDRLSRIGFSFFEKLFTRFGTKIEVISEVGNSKLDSEEIFEEIVCLIHAFSMKLYSKRKGNNILISDKNE